jgi:hypothetical protein
MLENNNKTIQKIKINNRERGRESEGRIMKTEEQRRVKKKE